MANKETVNIIINVGESMEEKYDDLSTKLEFSKESAILLLRQKLLFSSNDHFSVLLLGSDLTEDEHYQNCRYIKSQDKAELETLKVLKSIKSESGNNGDLITAIEYSIRSMQKEYGTKKFNKRIFILTDGNSSCSEKKVSMIASLINSTNVKINIITIGFYRELDSEEGEVLENDEDNQNQRNTKKVLMQLQDKCGDQIKVFSAQQANYIQNQFRKKKISPTTKYQGALRITPKLSLSVVVYVKSSNVTIPSLKKYSKNSEFKDDIKANKIQNERIFFVHDDKEKTPVSDDRIVKGYKYGKSVVPISEDLEKMFNSFEEKDFRAIGFTDDYNVPRQHYMGGTDAIFPNPNDSSQVKAFYAMVESMISLNKVLICRFVAKQKSRPKLVVLHPHIGTHGPVLYSNQLPTIEDIRDYQFDSLQQCRPEQEEVMANFIDELDMDGNDGEEEILKPSETYNPILQYFYQCLEHRAMNRLENNMELENDSNINDLPPMDERIKNMINPTRDKLKESKYANALKEVFSIKKRENAPDKKKRVFWRDIIQSELNEENGISEARVEEKLGKQKDEAPKEISSLRPLEDFKDMINYKLLDLTDKALSQMKQIIKKLINESFKGSFYLRAIDCLKALREESDKNDEIETFNTFMGDLVKTFPKERYIDFWRMIINNRLTLIYKEENSKSNVSQEEANNWLNILDKKNVITENINEIDNLVDDLD